MRTTRYLVLLPMLVAGCVEKSGFDWQGISSFKIEVTAGELGSETDRLPPAILTPASYDIRVRAINGRGEDKSDWNGEVPISVVPGELHRSSDEVVTLTNGVGTATVVLERAYDVVRIWVEDLGTAEAPGSFATGVTDAIWRDSLTIRAIQESDSTVRSPFMGERPTITNGTMVVTRISGDGFYVTDIDEAEWHSIFAFNFDQPFGLNRGDQLSLLEGGIAEFLGFTELSFPIWEVSGTLPVPDPVQLDCINDVDAGGLAMERWEAALVEVTEATILLCNDGDCGDYEQYGQWIIELNACAARLNAISAVEVPSFDPQANQMRTMESMRGTVRHIRWADPPWIIEPRDEFDICCTDCNPSMTAGCP